MSYSWPKNKFKKPNKIIQLKYSHTYWHAFWGHFSKWKLHSSFSWDQLINYTAHKSQVWISGLLKKRWEGRRGWHFCIKRRGTKLSTSLRFTQSCLSEPGFTCRYGVRCGGDDESDTISSTGWGRGPVAEPHFKQLENENKYPAMGNKCDAALRM